MRSGTLNVPGIVGLGEALTIAGSERPRERERLAALRDRLERELTSALDAFMVNGVGSPRLSNTTNFSIPGRVAGEMMRQMPELAVSTSAACTSATRLPSYVLGAMGLSDEVIRGSLRVSLGRFTTDDEIDRARDGLIRAAC